MLARKVLPVLAVALIAALLAAGCAKKEATPVAPSEAPTVAKVPADKIVYFNPKDPKEVSDKPGKSKTGAELVAGVYQCPMHPGQMSNQPGKCPIPTCGMNLALTTVPEAEKSLKGAAGSQPATAGSETKGEAAPKTGG